MSSATLRRTATTKPPFTYSFRLMPTNPGPPLHQLTYQVLRDNRHPFHIPTKRRVQAYDRASFYWIVKVGGPALEKRVLRSWARRRIRVAFEQELRASGLDAEGRVIGERKGKVEVDKASSDRDTKGRGDDGVIRRKMRPLRGTLVVHSTEAVVAAPFRDIQARCRDMLEYVMQRQRWT